MKTVLGKMLKFEIGNKLDVYREFDAAWLIATIIRTKEKEIKINYLSWPENCDTWIPKDSPFLAPLNTHTLPVVELSPSLSGPSTELILHQRSIIFNKTWYFCI